MSQIGGGKCSVCGAPGTNKSTCPGNPKAKKPNPKKHSNWNKSTTVPNALETKTATTKAMRVPIEGMYPIIVSQIEDEPGKNRKEKLRQNILGDLARYYKSSGQQLSAEDLEFEMKKIVVTLAYLFDESLKLTDDPDKKIWIDLDIYDVMNTLKEMYPKKVYEMFKNTLDANAEKEENLFSITEDERIYPLSQQTLANFLNYASPKKGESSVMDNTVTRNLPPLLQLTMENNLI